MGGVCGGGLTECLSEHTGTPHHHSGLQQPEGPAL